MFVVCGATVGRIWKSPCGMMELREGAWQDVLADVEADCCITDPPYSPKVHDGFESGSKFNNATGRTDGHSSPIVLGGLPYRPIDQDHCNDLASRFSDVTWFVCFGDHISNRMWESAMVDAGRYTFAPVIWVKDRQPRFQGDGPSSDCEYIAVSRRRERTKVGSLPGSYRVNGMGGGCADKVLRGQKPIELMQQIICHYSKPGDLILEPFCGSGTTLLASAIEGRKSIGAEIDPKTYDLAVKRLSQGYTPRLQMESKPKPKQGNLI